MFSSTAANPNERGCNSRDEELFKKDERGRFIIEDLDSASTSTSTSSRAGQQHDEDDDAVPFADLVDHEASRRFGRRKRTASAADLDSMDDEEAAIASRQAGGAATSASQQQQHARKRQRRGESDDDKVGGLGLHTGREYRAKKVPLRLHFSARQSLVSRSRTTFPRRLAI